MAFVMSKNLEQARSLHQIPIHVVATVLPTRQSATSNTVIKRIAARLTEGSRALAHSVFSTAYAYTH